MFLTFCVNNRQRDEDTSHPAASSGLLLKSGFQMILLALLFIFPTCELYVSFYSFLSSFSSTDSVCQIAVHDVSWIIKSNDSSPCTLFTDAYNSSENEFAASLSTSWVSILFEAGEAECILSFG